MILDADAESLLLAYVRPGMAARGMAVTVATKVPAAPVTESLVIYRTGGQRRDLVTDRAQITVDARAKTESRAVTLLNMARALINDLPGQDIGGHAIYDVLELSGPGNLPTEIDAIRYTQSFLVSIRAASIA